MVIAKILLKFDFFVDMIKLHVFMELYQFCRQVLKFNLIVNNRYIQLKNSQSMLLSKRHEYYQHIRRSIKLQLIKQARNDAQKNIQLDNQIKQIFAQQNHIKINNYVIENLSYATSALIQNCQHNFVKLDLQAPQSLKFATLCIQIHSVLPKEFFEVALRYFTQKIKLAYHECLDMYHIEQFIVYFATFLNKSQIIEMKSIETIKEVYNFWYKNIQGKQQFYQTTIIFLGNLLKIDPQYFYSCFIEFYPIVVFFPSKSLLKTLKFILQKSTYIESMATCSIYILANQSFSSLIYESLNGQYKKQALMLLGQVVNFSEWNIILQKNVIKIIEKIFQLTIFCQQQEQALYVLTNMAIDRYNELEIVFSRLDFTLLIKNIRQQNFKQCLKLLFCILQSYQTNQIWRIITTNNRFLQHIEDLREQKYEDLLQHWVYILYKQIQKEEVNFGFILGVIKAKQKLDISQETYQYIEQLARLLPNNQL